MYRWGTDAQTELLQLQHGNIDSIGEGIGPSLVPQVSAQPSLDKYVVKVPLPAVQWIGLNLHNPPFTDVRVRQALNWAINREQIGHIIYGEGVPWGLPFPRTSPAITAPPRRTATTPRRPSRCWPRPEPSTSVHADHDSDDPNPSIAQIMQQQLKAVGVTMSIDTVSAGGLQHRDREEELHRGARALVPGAADGAGHPHLQLHHHRLVELLELFR